MEGAGRSPPTSPRNPPGRRCAPGDGWATRAGHCACTVPPSGSWRSTAAACRPRTRTCWSCPASAATRLPPSPLRLRAPETCGHQYPPRARPAGVPAEPCRSPPTTAAEARLAEALMPPQGHDGGRLASTPGTPRSWSWRRPLAPLHAVPGGRRVRLGPGGAAGAALRSQGAAMGGHRPAGARRVHGGPARIRRPGPACGAARGFRPGFRPGLGSGAVRSGPRGGLGAARRARGGSQRLRCLDGLLADGLAHEGPGAWHSPTSARGGPIVPISSPVRGLPRTPLTGPPSPALTTP